MRQTTLHIRDARQKDRLELVVMVNPGTATRFVATWVIGLINGWSFGAVGRQESEMIAQFNESEVL